MRRGRGERWFLSVFSILMLGFLLAPTLMIIASSLNLSPTLTFPPQHLTLIWYREALTTLLSGEFGGARHSLIVSLVIALTSATSAGVIGVAAAYGIVRYRFPGRHALEQLVSLPLLFPSVSFGVGLLLLLNRTGFESPYGRLVLAHTILVLPFVIRNVVASLTGIGISLEEAAWMLGAGKIRTFFKVILPLARPGILAGLLLSFIISFNEFTVSFFLYSPEVQPFSIWVFQRTEAAFDTTLTAIGTLILGLNLLLVRGLQRVSGGERVGV